MHKTLTALFAALLGSSLMQPNAEPVPQPPVLPGPGGVADAVKTFLERLDDGADVKPLLAGSHPDLEFVFVDGAMKQASKEQARVPSFQDLDAQGRPFATRTVGDFVGHLDKLVATDAGLGREVTTTIDRIRANCQSEQCSLATVEFTRSYALADDRKCEHKMRATVLLRWERNKLGDFRIYHWHASRR